MKVNEDANLMKIGRLPYLVNVKMFAEIGAVCSRYIIVHVVMDRRTDEYTNVLPAIG